MWTEPEAPSETRGGLLRFKCTPSNRERPVLLRTPFPGRARRALPAPDAPARPNPTLILGVILATYLMIILDATVVITALPSIAERLDFSAAALSWVQSAYALTFGGLLLLGARMGDILGRRRTFVGGIALFTVASLAGGLAQSPAWLLAARALQGVGAAIAAPSSLALLTTSFREGPERTRALAAYGAVAGGGGSVGLVLGGMLTDWVSWRWGLWINVPVGAALIWLAPRVLAETERRPGRFDLPGAAASTAGMTALVYGFVHAAEAGWGDALTVASFAAGVALLATFVAVERRAAQPVTPLRLFASRQRAGAYLGRMLLVGGMFSMFYFLSQYLQGVRGFTPLQAGLGFLPMTAVMFSTVRFVPRMAARWGDARLLVVGVSVALAGMTWLSRLDATTPFFPDIVLPLVLLGLGMGSALAPLTGAALAGVAPADAGAASGVVNAAQQLGVSLGLSVLVTVAAGAGGASAGAGAAPGLALHGPARVDLAHAVSAALTGSSLLLALGLAVVVAAVGRFGRGTAAPVLEVAR
jgi:EmrB/QacA subfamily drug resistance transporter